MKQSSRQKPKSIKGKLLALFAFFFLLFNSPFIGLIDDHAFIAGIPAIYLYFFLAWLMLTFIMWRMVRQFQKS